MVFQDLSAPQTNVSKASSQPLPLASASDRVLALLFDFLILSPVISLAVAGLMRQTKTFFLLNSASQEGLVAAALVFVAIVFCVVLLQTLSLYYWQATPGQFFMQIRVISYPQEKERLSINQCLVRALLWSCGFIFLAIPFLEVLSHSLRRSFHERASDTLVITLKKNFDEGPYPIESKFIASWLRMSFLFLLLFAVMGYFKTYQSLRVGEFREKGQSNPYVCKEIKDLDFAGISRLDAALSLFLLDEISPECLDKESEASLWSDPVNSQDLAYLAKVFVTEGDVKKEYLGKVCTQPDSASCAIARYLNEDGQVQDIEPYRAQLWTARFLISEEKFAQQDFIGSLQIIEELQKLPVFKKGLEKRYVRSIWALNEMSKKSISRNRAPASENKSQSWIETFKDKYEVP